MDRFINTTAPALRGCWAIALAIGVLLVSRAMGTGGEYVLGLYFGVYSVYCLSNFARCRETHCIITGFGWGILAVVAVAAALTGRDWFGLLWDAFLVVFVVGHGFELLWAARTHSHALRL
jgi:hypothetical protein